MNRNGYLLTLGLVGTTWLTGCAAQRSAWHTQDCTVACAEKSTPTDTPRPIISTTPAPTPTPMPMPAANSVKLPVIEERQPEGKKPITLPEIPASRHVKPEKVLEPPARKDRGPNPVPPPLLPNISIPTVPVVVRAEPVVHAHDRRRPPEIASPPSAKSLDALLRDAQQLAPNDRATAPTPVRAFTPIAEYEHASMTGQVHQWRQTWRLRFAPVDAIDTFGGSVILSGGPELGELREGQRIRVRGLLVPNAERLNTPVYQVQSLEVLDQQ